MRALRAEGEKDLRATKWIEWHHCLNQISGLLAADLGRMSSSTRTSMIELLSELTGEMSDAVNWVSLHQEGRGTWS